MEFQNEIVSAIRQIMPADAQIQVVGTVSGFNVGVSWKLHDDPDRPNKMSKTISIRVASEAAQDFANASGPNQAEAYRRINSFLAQKLASFDPSHNAPKYEAPPVEQWVISSSVLFG